MMRPEQSFDTDQSISVNPETKDDKLRDLDPIVSMVREKFIRADTKRRPDVTRWLTAANNYRAVYGADMQFTETERCRVFVKVTKTKVLAAYGQIAEVIFSGSRFPITVEATPVPEGIEDTVHVDMEDPKGQPELHEAIGYPGDGNDLKPGDTLLGRLGSYLSDKFKGAKFKDGPGQTPKSVTFSPAEIAAKKMDKQIQDQLEESGAGSHLRMSAFEMVMLGTGVIKGPFTVSKEYPDWDESGEYNPKIKDMPRIESTSIWNFYPDPEALSMQDADYVIERHKMSASQLRALKKRPMFIRDAIEAAIEDGPNYEREYWENEIQDNSALNDTDRFEVLEYWGTVHKDQLKDEYNVTIPSSLKNSEEFQINAWICGNHLLRVVVNPFLPRRIPYLVCPYELNPYNIFGVGLAENMEDLQTLMNGFTRLTVDNAVLSANIMLEVDETNLVPGQDMRTYPGKVWRRAGGPPGQAIYAIKWPNTIQENMGMVDRLRQMTDDVTGIPSYSHGQSGIQSTGRTASGMSMLMGASALNIKTVIKNLDDYILRPLGEAMFHWNMQFAHDPEIKGDLEIKASGTKSLMMREVKSQRLISFLQVASNPAVASFVKFPVILRDIAESLDLDPDKIINNMEEASLQAALIATAGGNQPGAPTPPPGANPMDQGGNGGGNIGTGAPVMPGQPGFSAAPQQNPAAGAPQQPQPQAA